MYVWNLVAGFRWLMQTSLIEALTESTKIGHSGGLTSREQSNQECAAWMHFQMGNQEVRPRPHKWLAVVVYDKAQITFQSRFFQSVVIRSAFARSLSTSRFTRTQLSHSHPLTYQRACWDRFGEWILKSICVCQKVKFGTLHDGRICVLFLLVLVSRTSDAP